MMTDFDISDPTDFEQLELRELDGLLRCAICKDEYQDYAPVMLVSCGHGACSLCMNKSVKDSGVCPICRESTDEAKIRPNRELEAVARQYVVARRIILNLARASLDLEKELEKEREKLKKEMMESSNTLVQTNARSQASIPEAQESEPSPTTNVECPLCQQFVMYKNLNRHIDNKCPKEQEKPKSNSFFTMVEKEPKKKLPIHVFDLMKDKDIKELAKNYKLSCNGTRFQIVRRLEEYVTRFNANCDSSNPKPVSQIRRDVVLWEQRLDKPQPMVGQSDKNTSNTKEAEEHMKTHKHHFDLLVNQARQTLKKRKIDPDHSAGDSPAHSTTQSNHSNVEDIILDSE